MVYWDSGVYGAQKLASRCDITIPIVSVFRSVTVKRLDTKVRLTGWSRLQILVLGWVNERTHIKIRAAVEKRRASYGKIKLTKCRVWLSEIKRIVSKSEKKRGKWQTLFRRKAQKWAICAFKAYFLLSIFSCLLVGHESRMACLLAVTSEELQQRHEHTSLCNHENG